MVCIDGADLIDGSPTGMGDVELQSSLAYTSWAIGRLAFVSKMMRRVDSLEPIKLVLQTQNPVHYLSKALRENFDSYTVDCITKLEVHGS